MAYRILRHCRLVFIADWDDKMVQATNKSLRQLSRVVIEPLALPFPIFRIVRRRSHQQDTKAEAHSDSATAAGVKEKGRSESGTHHLHRPLTVFFSVSRSLACLLLSRVEVLLLSVSTPASPAAKTAGGYSIPSGDQKPEIVATMVGAVALSKGQEV